MSATGQRKRPPWLTAADDAELAVLVHELVDGALEHRERCAICSQSGPWCRPLREAFEIVADWQARRSAFSFATAMRALQNMVDSQTVAPPERERDLVGANGSWVVEP